MQSLTRKVLQATSGAVVLIGALVLGPTQSSATSPDLAGFCSASEQRYCIEYCESLYGPNGSLARCTKYSYGAVCSCQPV
ncbi:MAG TPA: hypothetical protein VFQ76_09965 [Longimicrobiaceae bacterium]|nr:hypothetical protein [Longimicrobiaceae bacterium]